jgi:3'-5' exoribonuclease
MDETTKAVPRTSVAQLEPNAVVTTYLMVDTSAVKQTKTDKTYFDMSLMDATGKITARAWDAVGQPPAPGEVIKVRAGVELYKDMKQLNVQEWRLADSSEYVLADYLPHTKLDIEETWSRAVALLEHTSKETQLWRLITNFIHDEEFAKSYKRCPAASGNHHAYVGGLLEHSWNMMQHAFTLSHFYGLNQGLMVTAAFLHDAGKVFEYTFDRSIGYTIRGRLFGHILDILTRIAIIREREGIDEDLGLIDHLCHIIASHHGNLEWGAIKTPSTPEAILFHQIDMVDAKMGAVAASLAGAKDAEGLCTWSKVIGGQLIPSELLTCK